jgi:hypothetical protein
MMHPPVFRRSTQFGILEFNSDGKIKICFGNRDHLLGLGVILPSPGLDKVAANLLHKLFLRGDADKHG